MANSREARIAELEEKLVHASTTQEVELIRQKIEALQELERVRQK